MRDKESQDLMLMNEKFFRRFPDATTAALSREVLIAKRARENRVTILFFAVDARKVKHPPMDKK